MPKKPESADPARQGRPPLLRDGQRVNVYLDAKSIARAKALGQGNVSEGIRKALARP